MPSEIIRAQYYVENMLVIVPTAAAVTLKAL